MIEENKKCNNLNGKEWLQNSISIWRNLSKTKEEKDFEHPAIYPVSLCEKLIRTFAKNGSNILDPFNGIGSCMVATQNLGCRGTGIDLSERFCSIAKKRIGNNPNINILNGDSFTELDKLDENSFDLCLTSPPYWNILNMKRSADKRESASYSNKREDLGNISDYKIFLDKLELLFIKVNKLLMPNAYCLINVMDIRKKNKFYPLHIDLAIRMEKIGYIFDDIIIWDRQPDYSNMRPLGYPYKFRINKVHEYILIFIKK